MSPHSMPAADAASPRARAIESNCRRAASSSGEVKRDGSPEAVRPPLGVTGARQLPKQAMPLLVGVGIDKPTSASTGRAATRAARSGVFRRLSSPWVLRVLALFIVSRVVTTSLFFAAMVMAQPGSLASSTSSIFQLMASWDGGWYRIIDLHGYPATLPVLNGRVVGSAWAFLPAYPLLVRTLSLGLAPLFSIVGELVAVVFGAGSTVLLVLLLRRHVSERRALAAAAIYVLGPAGYVLQIAYADSMALFLTFAVLCLLDRHRYLSAVPVVLLLGLTRPGGQAIALTVGLHLLLRVRQLWAARKYNRKEWVPAGLLLVAATASGFIWPWIAAVVTGRADAYLITEQSWRQLPQEEPFRPFDTWIAAAAEWWGFGGKYLLLPVVVMAIVLLVTARRVRGLGEVSALWIGSWAVYLLLVANPTSSLVRFLMPIAPVGAIVEFRSRWQAVLLALILVGLQAYWLFHSYLVPWQQNLTP